MSIPSRKNSSTPVVKSEKKVNRAVFRGGELAFPLNMIGSDPSSTEFSLSSSLESIIMIYARD